MHYRIALALATILLLSPTLTLAQEPERPRNRFDMEDANGDGKVSRREFSGPDRAFDRFDRNRDGYITRLEMLETARERRGGNRNPLGFKAPDDLKHEADVQYGDAGGRPLFLDTLQSHTPPEKPRPALVYVHGGGWRSGDKTVGLYSLIPFAKDGYFCASIDYRLTDEATFPAQIEDAKCAIRYLRANAQRYNIDQNRIGVWGASAGGHLVALLGTSGDVAELEGKSGWADTTSRVQAVCDWYGPTDLTLLKDVPSGGHGTDAVEALLGGTVAEKEDLARMASPVTYVSDDDPPFLIMHGEKDPLVGLRQSKVLHAALQEAGIACDFRVIEHAAHGGPQFRTQEIQRQVKAFFDRVLGVEKKPLPIPRLP